MTTVLLDALGTILELERPGPHLKRELRARGTSITSGQAEAAMRAEMAFYREAHHGAGTRQGLAELQHACARVVRDSLHIAADLPDVEAALLASVRFAPYPEVPGVLGELREAGCRLVVVSNWDISLHGVLEQTGLAPLVDAAISSAEAGVAKPDPALFAQALALVDGTPEDAWMVGDTVDTDVEGGLAAGLRAVLVARTDTPGLGSFGAGEAAPEGVPTLPSLAGLPELVRYRR